MQNPPVKALTKRRSIWLKSLAAAVLCLSLSAYFADIQAMLSVGAGIFVAAANFWLLEYVVSSLQQGEQVKGRRIALAFLLKAFVMFGVLGFIVLKLPIAPGFFLLGLSCFVLGITAEGLLGLGRKT